MPKSGAADVLCKLVTGIVLHPKTYDGNVLKRAAVGTETNPLPSATKLPPPVTRIPDVELISIAYWGDERPIPIR